MGMVVVGVGEGHRFVSFPVFGGLSRADSKLFSDSNDVRFGMLLMERRVDEVHFVTEYLVVA